MTAAKSRRLLGVALLVALLAGAIGLFAPALAAPAHWSAAPNAQLEACDALADTDPDGALYCLERYQASAAGLWTDSTGPEFAGALPLLSVVGVFAVGLTVGLAVVPR